MIGATTTLKRILTHINEAWRAVDAGWFGEALQYAYYAKDAAGRALGEDHEITRTVTAFHDRISAEHYNPAPCVQDPDALRWAYLAAWGAIAAASDNDD